jgi:hypothetical protein
MISDRLFGSARRHRRGAATRLRLPFAVAAVALAVFVHSLAARDAHRSSDCAANRVVQVTDFGLGAYMR